MRGNRSTIPLLALSMGWIVPGSSDAGPSDVIINEILYRDDSTRPDGEFIELHNRGSTPVDMGGWTLSNSVSLVFPAGTLLGPAGFLVVAPDAAEAMAYYGVQVDGEYSGRLDNDGETIALADGGGHWIDSVSYERGLPWPTDAYAGGVSLELRDPWAENGLPSSWGVGQPFSPGAPNRPASIAGGDVVITEIMYRPQRQEPREAFDPVNGGPYLETGDDEYGEYVELFNRGNRRLDLSGWTFDKGIGYAFPSGTTLDPGAYLVIAAAPQVLRPRHGLDGVLGPFEGHLDGSGERITLRDAGGLIVDTVSFEDHPPWPRAPDGLGVSLECIDPSSPNDTPANWRSSTAEFPATAFRATGMATSWKLDRDWSDTSNPNGAWSYRNANGNVITARSSRWLPSDLGPDQPAWTAAGDAGVPGWCKSTGRAPSHDFPAGWVGTHGPSEVRWTSPGEGQVEIGGGLYLPRHIGRNQVWKIQRNDEVLTSGTLASAETGVDSEDPKPFALGTGGAPALVATVRERDAIRFIVLREPGSVNDFVAYEIQINFTPGEILGPPVGGAVGRGTPGRENSVATAGLPPLIEDTFRSPEKPTSADQVTILAKVSSTKALAAVRLEYFLGISGDIASMEMFDDGTHRDGEAGDRVYGVRIPAAPSQTLVHYRIRASDVMGRSTVFPYEGEPSPTMAYFHHDNEINSQLVLFHLFLSSENLSALESDPRSDAYVDGSLVIDGIAHPHVGVRFRGRRSRTDPKHPWQFKFDKGDEYRGNRVLDTMFSFPLEQKVAFDIFDRAGILNLESELIRVHLNGDFWGVYVAFEAPTGAWLDKHSFDEGGELYKARTVETDGEAKNSDLFHNQIVTDEDYWGAWNKRIRPLEPPAQIREITDKLNDLPDAQLLPWLDAHVDLDGWFARWALYILMNIDDFGGHNHYLFIPGEPGGKWKQLAYDFDSGFTYSRVGPLRALYGDGGQGDLPAWQRNKLCQRVSANATLRRIYFLKMRRLIEDVYRQEIWFPHMDELFSRMTPDRTLDIARWGSRTRSSTQEMKEVFLGQRNSMLTFLQALKLPGATQVPRFEPPGGKYQGRVSVKISVPEGWYAAYTLDGTDPRLSDTAEWFSEPIRLTGSVAFRAAGLWAGSRQPNPASGGWTDLAEEMYEIEGAGIEPFIRGDANADGKINVTDAIRILSFLFLGGPELPCERSGDIDGRSDLNMTDAIVLLRYLFVGGSPPAQPFPSCGMGQATEALNCDGFAPCP